MQQQQHGRLDEGRAWKASWPAHQPFVMSAQQSGPSIYKLPTLRAFASLSRHCKHSDAQASKAQAKTTPVKEWLRAASRKSAAVGSCGRFSTMQGDTVDFGGTLSWVRQDWILHLWWQLCHSWQHPGFSNFIKEQKLTLFEAIVLHSEAQGWPSSCRCPRPWPMST